MSKSVKGGSRLVDQETAPLRRGRSGRDDGGVTALGVLGPLLLAGDAGPVRIGSARQRRLLAALTAHLGSPSTSGRLVDLVWADDVPADPAGAVQTNVARLRRLLPGGIRLATTPEGYRLEADREVVDVTAFADHLAAATATADLSARRDRLGAALALWRGPRTRARPSRAGRRGRPVVRTAGRRSRAARGGVARRGPGGRGRRRARGAAGDRTAA